MSADDKGATGINVEKLTIKHEEVLSQYSNLHVQYAQAMAENNNLRFKLDKAETLYAKSFESETLHREKAVKYKEALVSVLRADTMKSLELTRDLIVVALRKEKFLRKEYEGKLSFILALFKSAEHVLDKA